MLNQLVGKSREDDQHDLAFTRETFREYFVSKTCRHLHGRSKKKESHSRCGNYFPQGASLIKYLL